jgi:hypothetical protein
MKRQTDKYKILKGAKVKTIPMTSDAYNTYGRRERDLLFPKSPIKFQTLTLAV